MDAPPNVEVFPGAAPKNPDAVLASAMGRLSQVLVLGYDKERFEWQAASDMTLEEKLWLLERAKHELITAVASC